MDGKVTKFLLFLKSCKGFWFVILVFFLINIILYFKANDCRNYIDVQQRKDATGFAINYAKKFSYFYYYTGHFPLASLNSDLKYSKEAAQREIHENGDDLIMEYRHWSRMGENARIWAFLPNSIVSGSPENHQIRLFNFMVFISALSVLYFGFWRLKKVAFGILLLSLINLTPFFIYETYINENIFALLGSVFFMILGLNIYALFEDEKKYLFLFLTSFSGAIVGFFSEFRNEISLVFVSLILICLLARNKDVFLKTSALVLCSFVFIGTKYSIRSYFENQFNKTTEIVSEAGGHVYVGKKIPGHLVWHPIYCGLGDFDEKYGYEWNDKVAYGYATPILKEKYGLNIHYSNKYYLDDYYDKDSLYYIKFEEIDEYESIVKNKVLNQIKNDPVWYLTIIFKRVIRTLSMTIPIPFIGWFIFYVFYYLYRNRMWSYFKILCISLPLSASSILIYSGKGITYNSVFVYFVILCLIVIWKNKREKRLKFLNNTVN